MWTAVISQIAVTSRFGVTHLVHETQRLVANLEKAAADFHDLAG
jgi:hypothetical protein